MRVLVTGANGYIGTRLIPILLAAGHHVIALVRSQTRLKLPKEVEILQGDLHTLKALPKEIDAVYYLVHSMSSSKEDFLEQEKRCAKRFVDLLKQTNVKQILYLSALTTGKSLSKHFLSRHNVEEIFKKSPIPCTIFRAGIVIGSGSASFEIVYDLVEHLPAMVAPKWINNRCQPIAIYDVLYYLQAALLNKECFDHTFDIGGPDCLTYKQMMLKLAHERELKRFILTVPVLTPRLSSYWLYFVTATNFALASSLVDSLRSEAVCLDHKIETVLPHTCMSYEEAIRRALKRNEESEVFSSWKDAIVMSKLLPDLSPYHELPERGCIKEVYKAPFTDKEATLARLFSIGGYSGWYSMNWAWSFRGFIDKLCGGVGLRRGRSHPTELHVGDALDFWRVVAVGPEKLTLYAEMRIPGEAWLDFEVKEAEIVQTVGFRPKGIFGYLYWYMLLPIHRLIFKGLVKEIAI